MHKTLDDAVRDLNTIVGRFPAYYMYWPPFEDSGLCVYGYDGKPSCLIGHLLCEWGMPYEGFPEKSASRVIADCIEGLSVDDDAGMMLDRVQCLQDIGFTWHSIMNAWNRAGTEGLQSLIETEP